MVYCQLWLCDILFETPLSYEEAAYYEFRCIIKRMNTIRVSNTSWLQGGQKWDYQENVLPTELMIPIQDYNKDKKAITEQQ